MESFEGHQQLQQNEHNSIRSIPPNHPSISSPILGEGKLLVAVLELELPSKDQTGAPATPIFAFALNQVLVPGLKL